MTSTTTHHHSPASVSREQHNLVTEFAAECSRRNINPPPAVIQALQNTVSTGGIFELQDCMLGEHAVQALCHALSYCFGPLHQQQQQYYQEHDDDIDDEDSPMTELCLRQLSIRNAYIGDVGCVTILRFLIKNCVNSLEILELPGNSISESVGDIATAIGVLAKLKKLVLDWNKIGAMATATTTSSNANNNNKTGSDFATAPSTSRARNTSSNQINLSNNHDQQSPITTTAGATSSSSSSIIPSNAVHRLLNALSVHHEIEQISLQNNILGRASVEDICHLIVTSKTLEHLDISWNSLGENGGGRVAAAVNRSASDKLCTVEVQGNSFSRKDCELIERKIRVNRDAGAKAEAARQQEDDLRNSIEKLQREILDLRSQLTETKAKFGAQEMLLHASKEAEDSAKKEREKYEIMMKEAQDTLHTERMNFQRKLDEEHNRCSEAIEQASRRLREACEAADDVQTKARVHRAEMDAEVATCRDRKYAAEKEAATASASAIAAKDAMERIQAEHSVVSKNLTESRQRVAELELQMKVRDDEIERLRAAASAHSIDLESLKSQMRLTQESNEQLKLKVKDLEYNIEQSERKRSEELRAALLRSENEQKEEVAAAERRVRQAEQDKLHTEKTMVELKAQFENTRRQFEQNSAEASSHVEKMRGKCSELELEIEKIASKCSLLEIESGRNESRAKSSEEKSRLLQQELNQSLHQHKDRIEELARDFERKLSDKETEIQDRQRESRVHAEEIALLKAKNEALSAKMKQQQVDLEKRVVKSLRSAMHDVQHHNKRNNNNQSENHQTTTGNDSD
jgi:hypothetical protein